MVYSLAILETEVGNTFCNYESILIIDIEANWTNNTNRQIASIHI